MKYMPIILSGCLISSVSFAENTNSPIELEADSGYFDQQSGLAVYEGNVKVSQGLATIWSHKMTLNMVGETAEKLEASGNKNTPVKFIYQGKKQPITGQGNQVTYQVKEKKVVLTGNAEIKQGSDIIKGKELVYYLEKEVIQGSRVKMTFKPHGE